ncbi:MAG: hypothetical protein KDA92_13310 [Planctomycetales bacterium]|nr:hypothetical protein [Planctomycetales bacterium]
METKTDALTRLRREGRWEAATRDRERKRQELRAQGVRRKAANDQAWEWMLAAYPPVDTNDDDDGGEMPVNATFFAAMASFPPRHAAVDADGEPPMADIWWAFCFLRALRFGASVEGQMPGARFVVPMMRDAPSTGARRFSLIAWHRPLVFYLLARAKFDAVVMRLAVEVGPDDEYLEEMQHHLSFVEEELAVLDAGEKAIEQTCEPAC